MQPKINDLDDLRKTEKKCETCACFRPKQGSDAGQGVCLLLAPEHIMADVPVPRMRGAVPDVDREGRPIMITEKRPAIRYSPTLASAVCFSGWRPIGAEPGESAGAALLRMRLPRAVAAMNIRALSQPEVLIVFLATLGADVRGMPGADVVESAGLMPDPPRASAGENADFSGTQGAQNGKKTN